MSAVLFWSAISGFKSRNLGLVVNILALMNVCCILGPRESPEAAVRRSQVSLPEQLLLDVDGVESSRTFSSLQPRATTWDPKVWYPYPLGCDFVRPST